MHFINVSNPSQANKYNRLLHGRNVMVLFYMNGCGFCELLKPEWDEFEKHMKKNNTYDRDDKYVIAQVNANFMRDIEGDKDVLGYPTIMHLLDGKKQGEFNNERNSNELIKYFKNMSETPGRQSGGRMRKTRRRSKKGRKHKSTGRRHRSTRRRRHKSNRRTR